MTPLEYSRAISDLAIALTREHHMGQNDPFVLKDVEHAAEALLQAKAHLSRAHRRIYGEPKTEGVA